MTAMKRISKKAQNIAFKILGIPPNIKNAKSKTQIKESRARDPNLTRRSK